MKTALAFSTLPFLLAACFAASPAAATDRDTDLLREVDSHKAGRPPRSIIGRANTCATQPIVCGQTVTGALASGDCALSDGTYVDFWTFPGQNGQAVTIDLSSNDFDSYLFLLDPTPTTADLSAIPIPRAGRSSQCMTPAPSRPVRKRQPRRCQGMPPTLPWR